MHDQKNFRIDYKYHAAYHGSMKTRGPKRLATITYGTLSRWTGMAEGSIRNAVHKGRLDLDGIDGLLRWANQRRKAKGLPMIGDPSEPPPLDPPSPDTDATETTTQQPALPADTPDAPTSPLRHPPSCRCNDCYLASKSRKT